MGRFDCDGDAGSSVARAAETVATGRAIVVCVIAGLLCWVLTNSTSPNLSMRHCSLLRSAATLIGLRVAQRRGGSFESKSPRAAGGATSAGGLIAGLIVGLNRGGGSRRLSIGAQQAHNGRRAESLCTHTPLHAWAGLRAALHS